MLNTKTKEIYKAFGFSINSEIYLPELQYMCEKVDLIDIYIKIEDVSELWYKISNPNSVFVVQENLVMFQVPQIAIFLIQEGKRIIVSPLEKYDEDVVRLYLLGTCMGALLLQRRIYPLHGSALAMNGKAIAIIGDSGAGKSTLAASLITNGYQLLSDDVIAVSFYDEIPFIIPAYPYQKLWQDSLDNFGMDVSKYKSIFGRETKYSVPVSSNYFSEPLPLSGIFELIKTDNKEEVEFCKVEGLERLSKLFSHTFRNFLIRDLGLMNWHFKTTTKILNKVSVYQLKRPVQRFSTPELASIIVKTI